MITDAIAFEETFEKPTYKRIVFTCNILFIFVFGIVLFWSLFARLDGGSYAPGRVIVQNKTQVIQHLEGGVVAEILVKDGDYVEKGAALLVLNDVNARSETQRLIALNNRLRASGARLHSERKLFSENPIFPTDIPRDVIDFQNKIYQDKEANYSSRIALLQERKALIGREYSGFVQKSSFLNKQIKLEVGIYDKKRVLAEQGFIPQNEVSEQEVKLSELKKERADTQTSVATTKRRMTETTLEIKRLQNEFTVEANEELKTVEAEIADTTERLANIRDVLSRTKILAPISGTITDLKFNTIGGVVSSGEEIVSIVPQGTDMLIEARINPQDINSVIVDQKAKIHLTAYKSIHVPSIDGVVSYVSADTVQDPVTGADYYTAYIMPDKETLDKLSKKVTLLAGMPADVTIIMGERSPFDYLISPLRDSLRKSFTEE